MRSTWTDSRLDEFKNRVDERLNGLDNRIGELSTKVGEMDTRLTGRIDSLQHTIMLVGGGLFAAFVAVLAAIIGLIATQL
jgi:hypothetical protein